MASAEDRKRLPVSLPAQLKAILKTSFQDELPENKNRQKRGGSGAPLSAWMLGSQKNSASKINSVVGGSSRFPYTHWGDSARALARRIGDRYAVTWVQQDLLNEYVLKRYRGRVDLNRANFIGSPSDDRGDYEKSYVAINEIRSALTKLGISRLEIPLRALIDERVTNIILLLQLNEVLSKAKPKRKPPWKPTN